MNITKENFNQYTDVAIELACEELYTDANAISLELYETWAKWNEESSGYSDELNAAQAVRILTFSQWRMVENAEDYPLLAEILSHKSYWSDEFIEENQNFTGAWILREKALAYIKLAKGPTTDLLYECYMDYAQSYINQAIALFEEVAANENDASAAELCIECKIDLAMIQRRISNRLARNTAISLFDEKLTDEQKDRLIEVYEEATDVLFDDFFNKKSVAIVQTADNVDDEVKENVLEFLLDRYTESGNEDPYWWLFTHKNAPEEREKIRFVENIEDAADNDFDEIPWVFTLDRYPFDIEFDEGEQPTTDSVYVIDTENTSLYHKIS